MSSGHCINEPRVWGEECDRDISSGTWVCRWYLNLQKVNAPKGGYIEKAEIQWL